MRLEEGASPFLSGAARGTLTSFLTESLVIEGIYRPPTDAELRATAEFLTSDLTAEAVLRLQAVYAPGYPLRDLPGLDVRVGRYVAPPGAPDMLDRLRDVLRRWRGDPYRLHVQFELLHPFLDGNGRVGRAIWAAAMLEQGQDPFALGFLHRFYYQTLSAAG